MVACFAVAIMFGVTAAASSEKIFDWNVFVLMFTALVLVYYSWETRNLRNEGLKANRIAAHAGLTLRWIMRDEHFGPRWHLHLSNQGKSSALNPRVVLINAPDRVTLRGFDGVNAIVEGDGIDGHLTRDDIRLAPDELAKFFETPVTAVITFSTMEDLGRKFETTVKILHPPYSAIEAARWI